MRNAVDLLLGSGRANPALGESVMHLLIGATSPQEPSPSLHEPLETEGTREAVAVPGTSI